MMNEWSGDIGFSKYHPDDWERKFNSYIYVVDEDDLDALEEEIAVTEETADSIILWP
jgi:hypothetical protein